MWVISWINDNILTYKHSFCKHITFNLKQISENLNKHEVLIRFVETQLQTPLQILYFY